MRPVSDAYNQAVRSSHVMRARARVVAPGQSGTDPDGTEIPILAGDVAFDATSAVRGTLDLTTDGTGWDPRPGQHQVQPYGTEIFVERGIQITAGGTEWVSMGYYRMYDVGQDQAPNGPLRIAGQDRMSAIVDARFPKPQQFPASSSVSNVIEQVVTDVLPDATIDFTADDQNLGRVQVTEDDRYGFLKDLVDSIGAVTYWDHRGVLVVKPVPDADIPVFAVDSGPGGVLVTASRSLSRDGVYNAVVATGEGGDDIAPVWAMAYDNDKRSPTYWGGPFGQVPAFYSSPLLTSSTQAGSAARAKLRVTTGLPYSVDFSAVPHAGLEPLDPIRLIYPGFSEVHVLSQLTMPLTAQDSLTGVTRKSLATDIGVS